MKYLWLGYGANLDLNEGGTLAHKEGYVLLMGHNLYAWIIVSLYDFDLLYEAHTWSINLTI